MKKFTAIFVIVLISGVTAQATIIYTNSNSRIEDEIQYTVMTDKATYQLGEDVHIQYQITNLSTTEDKLLSSPHCPPYEFWIQNLDGELVDIIFGYHLTVWVTINLSPLETRLFPYPWELPEGAIWDIKNQDGNLVDTGTYEVGGGLSFRDSTQISIPIQIIPEPASLVLLSLGLILVKKKKRNRT